MEVINIEDKSRWGEILDSFKTKSIYYKNEYVSSMMIGKEEEASLLYFDGQNSRMCFPVIISDISRDIRFSGKIEAGTMLDMETPYGYGGPLFDNIDENDLREFRQQLDAWARENNIVSMFTRFNPMCGNAVKTEVFYDETRYMHHTIFIDTASEETINKNMDPKCRNMVRKAAKNGVEIEIDETLDSIEDFVRVYEATMNGHDAEEMYYFSSEYYHYLREEFKDNIILINAKLEGKLIGASLFMYDSNEMHYHLSGSDKEYKNLACSNLILNEAAKWAATKGIKKFHLGGGMSEEDSLYKFKKRFNRNGELDFYIGKQIFDQEKYEALLDIRKMADATFNKANRRMIQYRA